MNVAAQRAERFDAAREEQRLATRCERLVELALARGAQQAEAYGVHDETLSISYEKGDLKLTQADESSSLGLRVVERDRLGFASTNQSGDAALERSTGSALDLARLSLPDPAGALPAPREPGPPLTLVDPVLAELPLEEAVERSREFVAGTLARDPRLSIDRASLALYRSSVAVHASSGIAVAQSDVCVALSLFGMAIDGDDVGGFEIVGDIVRDPALLEERMRAAGERFAEAALGNLAAGRADGYRGRVLFSPTAFLSIFISPLVAASSAIAVQRGRSAMADKLGRRVAATELEIVDDPRDAGLAGATRFDREGQPVERFTLVRAGVLESYLYNGYAACVEGRDSTGHATGGARSVPGLGSHALSVAPGSGGARTALAAELGEGLMVQRFSGTVDPASGDFSGVAKAARWLEGGEVRRSVRETLISGNAFELLRGELVLSSESESVMGRARAPWAIVDGVSVTTG